MSIAEITQLLLQYKYFILFPVVAIEGPVTTVISGLFIALKYFNFYSAFFIIVVGDLTGDILHYAFGYWGRERIINRWGHYFGITSKRVEQVEKHFEKNTGKTLILAKIFHGIGGVFLIAAGAAKIPFPKFIWYNFLGTVPKTLILISVGFYFGYAISTIKSYLELGAAIFIGIGIIAILAWLYFNKDNNNKQP